MDDLLEQAQANISENVDKQEKEKLYLVLQESLNELSGLEELNKTYKELRDKAIKDLYNVGISAQSLAKTTELTRQMIHRIVK
jgi:Mor family transcriptional regulator